LCDFDDRVFVFVPFLFYIVVLLFFMSKRSF